MKSHHSIPAGVPGDGTAHPGGTSHVAAAASHGGDRRPARGDAIIFRLKAVLLQAGRGAGNLLDRNSAQSHPGRSLADAPVIGESATDIWRGTGAENGAEWPLTAGKIHNLRLAIRHLNGMEIPAGHVFSFWRQIGRAGIWKGYVRGRELREGCIIPTTGGGLCQLSGALYDAALNAGFSIVERHAHTEIIPGSLAEMGRDATVFWNYIDLRFTSPYAFRIEATMDATSLLIRIRGHIAGASRSIAVLPIAIRTNGDAGSPQSCASCGVESCFRHDERSNGAMASGRAAYLVDDRWPEFDSYLQSMREERDHLLLPLNGGAYGKGNYAWDTRGFGSVRHFPLLTLMRAYRSRRLAAQGAARQRTLLAFHERLAAGYGSRLGHEVTHITVLQHLLPWLWRNGHLGGRTFDVLMTSLPLGALHERLNQAAALHPESPTLADFRADDELVDAESEALRHARRIITPHSAIAAMFGERATLLGWSMPESTHAPVRTKPSAGPIAIAFPASTLGRKGAYELREALRGLDVRLVLGGPQLEQEDFWQGYNVEQRKSSENWLDGIHAVVLPAFVEHRPRRLLAAVAHGIPVIASAACGLGHVQGVISVPAGDVAALREALMQVVSF